MATTKGKGGYGYGYGSNAWRNPSVLNRDVYFTDDPEMPYIIDYGRLANTSGLAAAVGLLGDRWYKNYLKRGREKAKASEKARLQQGTGEADPNSAITVDTNGISVGATPKAEELARQYNNIQNGNYIPEGMEAKGDAISISADKADASNAVSDAATAAAESGGNPYAMGAAMAAQAMEQQKRAKQAALQSANEQAVERREQMGQSSVQTEAPQTSQDVGLLQSIGYSGAEDYAARHPNENDLARARYRQNLARMSNPRSSTYIGIRNPFVLNNGSFNEPAAEQSPSGTTAGDDYAYDDYQIPSGAEENYGQRFVQQAQPQAAQQAPAQAERLTDTIPQQVAQAQEAAPPPRMSAGEWSKEKNNRKIERLTEKYAGSPNPASDKRDLEKMTNAVENGLANITAHNGIIDKAAYLSAMDDRLRKDGRHRWQRLAVQKYIEPLLDAKIKEQTAAKFTQTTQQYTDLIGQGKYIEAQKLIPTLFGLDPDGAKQLTSIMSGIIRATSSASTSGGGKAAAGSVLGADFDAYYKSVKDWNKSAKENIANYVKSFPDQPIPQALLDDDMLSSTEMRRLNMLGMARFGGLKQPSGKTKTGNGQQNGSNTSGPTEKEIRKLFEDAVKNGNLKDVSSEFHEEYYRTHPEAIKIWNKLMTEYQQKSKGTDKTSATQNYGDVLRDAWASGYGLP